ncbi:MAG: DUF4271 domain-containing protein [Leeuwenhoekiella sp.]
MEAITRNFIAQDWFTAILVVCLVLLAITRYTYERRFLNFIGVIGSDKYLKKSGKDKFQDPFNLMLFTVQLLSISAFIYLILVKFKLTPVLSTQVLFLRVIICYRLVIGVKFLMERIVAVLFNGEEILRPYHYNQLVFRNFFGMVLIPINALFAYNAMPGKYTIIGILIFLVLVNVFSIVSIVRRYEKLIINNFFYFILYLCALEIAPYLILYKLLSTYIPR